MASYLPGTIKMIIPQVSDRRLLKVVKRPLACALACAREVRLQGPGSGISLRNEISVFRPH